jgi:hypothetical protein
MTNDEIRMIPARRENPNDEIAVSGQLRLGRANAHKLAADNR